MTPDAVLRVAGPADAAALVELRAVMFEGMGTTAAAIADPRWRRAASDWFADRVTDLQARIVVAEAEGRVVSCAVGEVTALIPGPNTVTGSVGLISNVATTNGHRGRGLAAACTDDLLRWFVEETDVRRVDLFATEAGARIYTRRGFTGRGFESMCLPVPR
ncbi:MAG TPA: GNAT family N-acetyltransferase [Ornithinibacter sp.]|nr:GNAT family N-acetyltransferase [Ornithinibacter sp.]